MSLFPDRRFLNNKGIAIIWLALFVLPLLLFLAGMAIDIAYMYNVKNQLQVAADAAALAGAATLDESGSITQSISRQEAWKHACKNKAAGAPVFLATNSSVVCDSPPSAGSLNFGNSDTGDIVVGNWDPGRPVAQRFRPSPGNPLVAGDSVNAIKVTAKRTGETPGMPQVSVFVGQIFRLLGINWSLMSARAEAIAARPLRASQYIAMGDTACSSAGGCAYPDECTLTGNQYCVSAGHPDPCCTGPATGTCGGRVLVASPTSDPDETKFGWTSLLQQPGNSAAFSTLICNSFPSQNVCGTTGIWGISGTSTSTLRDFASMMYDPSYDSAFKEKDASGNVTSWRIMIPQNAISDPMSGPDPHPIIGYIQVRIIAICPSGAGIACRPYGPPAGVCSAYRNNVIVIDRISCISCGSGTLGFRAALVH